MWYYIRTYFLERQKNMVNIALLGFGVVGSGTAEVLTKNKSIIEKKLGCEYHIKYILDLREFPDSPFADRIVHDFNTILNDPEVTVVAEMMGGSYPAYDFTKACLMAGKSVVTSNKEVVSTFGVELCKIANENGVRYLFEASVGGGIPIIRPLMNDLSSNKVNRISGILNGTTNYILTSMRDSGATFEDALKTAQKLGYAEANPSADVDGIDAARKTVILAALASGRLVNPKSIYVEGITKITLEDTKLAESLGFTIKLIGFTEISDDGLIAFVSPRLVPSTNPLCRIDDVFNGVLVDANMVGEVMFYGPGAGKLPTASAVVADIIDIISNMDKDPKSIDWIAATEDDMADFNEYSCRRMFICNEKSNIVTDAIPDCEVKCVFGKYAYVSTDKISEKQAVNLAHDLGDSLVSAYRIL